MLSRQAVAAAFLLLTTQACMDVSVNVPNVTPPTAPSSTAGSGSCLRGEYRVLPNDGAPVSDDALDAIVVIIGNRLRDYGLVQSQFGVEAQGEDRVVVQFAAVSDEQELRQLIGSTGELQFMGVPGGQSDSVVVGEPVPADLTPILNSSHVAAASPGTSQAGQRAVDLTFTDEGALLFDNYAAGHFGEQFAVVLDGIVQSAPVIQAARFGGRAQISGSFETDADVYELVTVLRSGPLPNSIEEVTFGPCSVAYTPRQLQTRRAGRAQTERIHREPGSRLQAQAETSNSAPPVSDR